MTHRRRVCCYGALFPCCALTSLSVMGAAIALAAVFPAFLRSMVNKKVTIEEGHATYEQLQSPTLPVYKSFYIWNLTNPHDFASGKSIPQLEQLGPYTYRENRTKNFTKTSSDKTEITYTQSKLFHWDQNKSHPNVSETDSICTINLPLVGTVAEISRMDNVALRFLGREIVKFIFWETGSEIFMCNIPARNLTWNFTTDLVHRLHTNPLLELANSNYPRNYVSIQLNNSINDSNPSIIRTGVGNINSIAQFVQWDGLTKLNTWPDSSANDINGTEGLFFRPNLQERVPLETFQDDAVRSFPLEYIGKVKHKGLETHRYQLPFSVFQGAFSNPNNSRWGSYNPDGLFYLGYTQWPEAPVFGSKPHFLDGDPVLREKVGGMHPDRELHETAIDVEPITGANIQLKKQLQINMQVNQTEDFSQLEKVNGTVYFPILYMNEHAELTDDFKHYLEDKGLREVQLAKKLIWVVFAGLLFTALVCGILSLVFCGLFIKNYKKMSDGSDETTPFLH